MLGQMLSHGVVVPHGAVLRSFDARAAARAGGAVTLPSWLAIASATTGRVVQTSASTLLTGLGANLARARSVDGTTFGVELAMARTALETWSSDATNVAWLKGTGVTAAAGSGGGDPNGPDGTKSSSKLVFDGTGFANSFRWGQVILAGYTNGTPYTASSWLLVPSGENRLSLTLNQAGGRGPELDVGTSWGRYSFTDLGSGAQAQHTTYSAAARNIALAAYVYGQQVEQGRYPGPLIPTTSTTASIAADVLSIPTPATIAKHGYLSGVVSFAPHFASGEATNDLDLWNFSTVRLYLRASDQKLVLHTGGVDVVSPALTWSRNQEIQVYARHGSDGRRIEVAGATSGSGVTTGGADSSFSLPGTAYLLGNSSGAQECVDLRAARFLEAA